MMDDLDTTQQTEPPEMRPNQRRMSRPRTAVLDVSELLKGKKGGRVNRGVLPLNDTRQIIFVIRGIVHRVDVTDNHEIILGRFDDTDDLESAHVDLTDFGAVDRGVSREHCKLIVEGDNMYVADLGSTNGTFYANKRLDPQTPTRIASGDEIHLGKLPMQVLFQ